MKKSCLKCGDCLYYCPVYSELKEEGYSPRGRISLIEAKDKKGLEFSLFEKNFLHKCLLCGACERHCKENIELTELFIKERIKNFSKHAPLLKKTVLFFMKESLKVASVFNSEKSGKKAFKREKIPDKKTVLLFNGCSTKFLLKRVKEAAVCVLKNFGHDVIEEDFLCCGFPFLSSGDEKEFMKLMKKNMEIFSIYKNIPVITMCPTGKHTLKNYYELLNVYDIVEFLHLNKLYLEPKKSSKKSYSLHIPCHVINFEAPDFLIDYAKHHFPGIFVPSEQKCCGFGGVFSVSYRGLSKRVLKKASLNLEIDKDLTVLTNCPGCIIQFKEAGKAKHLLEEIVKSV